MVYRAVARPTRPNGWFKGWMASPPFRCGTKTLVWPLAGGPDQPLRGIPIAREVTEIIYGNCFLARPRRMLAAGFSVVVDATFLKRSQRGRCMAELAKRVDAEFRILNCTVCEDLALTENRTNDSGEGADPSEANQQVLEEQLRIKEDLLSEELSACLRDDDPILLG